MISRLHTDPVVALDPPHHMPAVAEGDKLDPLLAMAKSWTLRYPHRLEDTGDRTRSLLLCMIPCPPSPVYVQYLRETRGRVVMLIMPRANHQWWSELKALLLSRCPAYCGSLSHAHLDYCVFEASPNCATELLASSIPQNFLEQRFFFNIAASSL